MQCKRSPTQTKGISNWFYFYYVFQENGSEKLIALDSSANEFCKDLFYLDGISPRTCDTVHVFYVRFQQTRAEEIVSNVTQESNVSQHFIEFVHTLGWPVNVYNHPGYLTTLIRIYLIRFINQVGLVTSQRAGTQRNLKQPNGPSRTTKYATMDNRRWYIGQMRFPKWLSSSLPKFQQYIPRSNPLTTHPAFLVSNNLFIPDENYCSRLITCSLVRKERKCESRQKIS